MSVFTNYSQLYYSRFTGNVLNPSNYDELAILLKIAKQQGRPIRVVGRSHSLNCSNLPRGSELLITLSAISDYTRISGDCIHVGAGVGIKELQAILNKDGYMIPVENGGEASPTIGGFINAGGIGKVDPAISKGMSEQYGGFWENVFEIDIMDSNGIIHTIGRDDIAFKYLFGSYGQLAIIVGARLKIIKSSIGAVPDIYFMPEKKTRSDFKYADMRTLWFTFFVEEVKVNGLWDSIFEWYLKHTDYVLPVSNARWAGPVHNGSPIGFSYKIKFIHFNPPLLFHPQESFFAIGIAFEISTGVYELNERLRTDLKDLYATAMLYGGWPYSSVENMGLSLKPAMLYSPNGLKMIMGIRESFGYTSLLNCGWLDSCTGGLWNEEIMPI